MLTTFRSNGLFSLLVTSSELQAIPAYVYKNGKKTSEQRKDVNGKKFFRLRGVIPLIEKEVVPDGYVYICADESPQLPEVQIGQILQLDGYISLRAAKGFGLTCSLIGNLNCSNEFSLGG